MLPTSTSQSLTYLAGTPSGQIQVKTAVRAISGVEVLVRVTHSGLCGTDVHDVGSGCGLGHEGVGIIERIGDEVRGLRVGERVGWGWLSSSCRQCRECLSGYWQYCAQASGQKYGDVEQGAFGDFVVRHQDFVFPIPGEIESKYAGPLFCAGVTVYEALDVAQTKPSDVVGIVGMGGLGHVAILYAKAMGCSVVVFSGSERKRDDSIALGADEFVVLPRSPKGENTKGDAIKLREGVNVLLLCGAGVPDFETLIPLLARRAAIIPMVIQAEPFVIPYMPFLLPGHRIIASTDATRANHLLALSFAARHKIKPWIVEFPMSRTGLTDAIAALQSGKIRYRAVLSREEGGLDC